MRGLKLHPTSAESALSSYLSITRIHTMSTPSDEPQVIRRFSLGLDDNPDPSTCPNLPHFNLVPIPPTFIRDARYRGDAR